MKAYIQTDDDNDYINVNAFTAAVGFKSLGFEIIKYKDASAVTEKEADCIFVGGIGMIRSRLNKIGIDKPDEIEYPEKLQPFLNRKVWTSKLNTIISEEQTGIFVKPLKTKLFQGKVISQFSDFIGLNYEEDIDVWCSEVIDVVTEWRCFVRYGKIIDVRYYKGNWDSKLDLNVVNDAISKYNNQPAAYCLDFGVDKNGKHYLIEVNDGHSLGSYGMGAISYAKFLSARWSELTNTKDLLHF